MYGCFAGLKKVVVIMRWIIHCTITEKLDDSKQVTSLVFNLYVQEKGVYYNIPDRCDYVWRHTHNLFQGISWYAQHEVICGFRQWH